MSDSIDTSQGLDVGDAVLSFLADTTQLDVAFNRVADEAAATMGKAADSVGQVGDAVSNLGDELDATGDNVAYAGDKISEGMRKVKKSAEDAGQGIKYSFRDARESMMLTEETVGVRIPRALNGLLARIPMVGIAFEAMLPILGVVAAVDIIGKLVEKHEGLIKAQQRAALETENLSIKEGDQTKSMELANLKLDDQIAKLEGRPEQNKLKEALLETAIAADSLATKFAADFEKIDEALDDTTGWMGRFKQDMYSLKDLMFATPETFAAAWHKTVSGTKDVETALAGVHDQLLAINKLRAQPSEGKSEEEQVEQQKALAAAYEVMGQKAKAAMEVVQKQAPENTKAIEQLSSLVVSATAAQVDAGKTIENIHKRVKDVALENAAAVATAQEKGAKQALDAQLAAIDSLKSAQHAASLTAVHGAAMWAVAEVQATDAAAIAHESYLQKMVAAATRSGDALKIQAAQQKLATFQTKSAAEEMDKLSAAEQKHVEETRKVVEEYAHLVDANVAKEFEATAKAAEKLTAAEDELSKAQSKLAEDKLSQHYKDQESAITKLASMQLITEEQKDDRLKMLEQQQANAAIAILNEQLAKEKAAMDAAQEKVTYGKSNPLTVSPAQLADSEASLAKLATAYTNTQAQIVEAQEKFNKESEANDKSHYGRALLEAMAFGNELLAEGMRENHSALIAKEQELAQAKARHENTDAIKEEIAALKQKEQALDKAANGDTKAAAALLKQDQAQLKTAKSALADAQARGVDTASIKQHISSLEADTAALDKAVNGDRLLAAQKLISNQADLLQLQILRDLLKARNADTLAIDQQIIASQKLNTALQLESTQVKKTEGFWDNFTADFKKKSKDVGTEAQSMGSMMSNAATQMDNAFASAVMGALKSGQSVGAALEKATAQVLTNLATQAAAHALYCVAMGIAELATGVTDSSAAEWFAAAAEFGLVAGASGAAGLAMGGSGGSGSGQSAAPMPGQTTSSSAGGGGTNQTGGVTKLAAGGVVSKPTTFIAGDSPSGGEADEAILPLSDPSAMRQVANAIAPGGLPQSTPGEESAFDPESIKRMTEAISALTGTRDASQDFRFAEPATGEKAGFQFDGSTSPRSSDNRTVGEALGFYSGAYGERSPTDKPRFNSAEGTPSEKLNDDFGTPSAGDRPAFDFSQTPLPREMPDVQALAAQFGGGLLSASTLRAAADSQIATAAAAPPAVFDQASMEKFAARLDAQRDPSGGSGGEAHYHDHTSVNVKGLMDSGNLKKIIKKQNLLVKNRQATVNASNSLRVTRRSQ